MLVQQAAESAQGDWIFQPEVSLPGDKAGLLALDRVDQHPVLAVSQQAQRHAGIAQQIDHAIGRRRRPCPAAQRIGQPLLPQVVHNQQASLAGGGIAQRIVRREREAVFAGVTQVGRNGRPLAQQTRPVPIIHRSALHAQHFFQYKEDPGRVQRHILFPVLLVAHPLLIGRAQTVAQIRLDAIQAMGEDPLQHGHTQKRP